MVKKIIFFCLIIAAIFSAGIFIYFKINTPVPEKPILESPLSAVPTPISESELSFFPERLNADFTAINNAEIKIELRGERPDFIQLEMAYDPAIISEIKLAPGDIFINPNVQLNNIDTSTGRISYAISQADSAGISHESETAAVLSFKINKNARQGSTSIYFLPKTVIKGRDVNIKLNIAYGLEIIFGANKGIPTKKLLNE